VETTELVTALVAIIGACIMIVTRALLAYLGKSEAVKKFDHYKPFAIAAAKWVEEKVPDDYGADAEDTATARAVHKLDMFLAKFNETVVKFDGKEPSEELKREAMKWSVELAERLNLLKKKEG